ncbi:MAG TPA: tyrosine-type recombinase/integrase [Pseudogracilibacillus sp.]|nr:tyrosine-type recombinase/integrase [Pseudogracilibacillus sp.]
MPSYWANDVSSPVISRAENGYTDIGGPPLLFKCIIKEDRKIKIGDELAYYIKKLIQLSIENEFNLLFYEPSSKYKVISNSGVNNLLKNTLNQLNLEQISIHGLRHTHASILLYKKVSIEYVSERLGHRDIVTTYKFYSHVIKELRKDDEEKTIKIFK